MARYYRRSYRQAGGTPRFEDYREIEARFDSAGTCGHTIKRGDPIGYAPRYRQTQCAACWARWVAENREADLIEQGSMSCPW